MLINDYLRFIISQAPDARSTDPRKLILLPKQIDSTFSLILYVIRDLFIYLSSFRGFLFRDFVFFDHLTRM